MYRTNVIEFVNSSLKKVFKKRFFANDVLALKILYLRVRKLDKKCGTERMCNWS